MPCAFIVSVPRRAGYSTGEVSLCMVIEMRLASFAFIALLFSAALPAAADDSDLREYPYNSADVLAFDPNEKCKTATQSPNCVAKTAWACLYKGARNIDCGLIGFFISASEGEKIYEPAPHQPWRSDWLYGLAVINDFFACSMRPMLFRRVSPERFAADPPVPAERVGTHEMIVYVGGCPELGAYILGFSVFMKETTDGWRATSYKFSLLRPGLGDDDAVMVAGCDDYGCYGQAPHQSARSGADCVGLPCAYKAAGIPETGTPVPLNYPSNCTPPIVLPDLTLECARLKKDAHPLCKPYFINSKVTKWRGNCHGE